MLTRGFELGSSNTKFNDSILCAKKGLLLSVAVEIYNPPRIRGKSYGKQLGFEV